MASQTDENKTNIDAKDSRPPRHAQELGAGLPTPPAGLTEGLPVAGGGDLRSGVSAGSETRAEQGSVPPTLATISRQRGLDERRLRQLLRGELDWIVMKALEKDRSRRYESASALASDIRNYLDNLPIQARPASWWLKTNKWRRRNPVAAISIAAGAVLSMFLLGGMIWHNQRLSQSLAVSDQLRKDGFHRETVFRQQQYVDDMRLARHAIGTGDGVEARRLLERHSPHPDLSDYVGFEWHYLRHRAPLPRLTMTGHSDPLLSVDVSPNERFIASSDRGGEVRIWEMDSGKLVKLLRYSDLEVTTVRFSPDGKWLATAGMDMLVHLWSVGTWREVAALSRHERTICSVAWSPDGKRLASAGRDNSVHVWDATSHSLEQTLSHGDVVRAVSWSPDGRVLATADGDRGIHLWETSTWRDRGRLGSHNDRFLCIAFSPDSRTVAAGGYGNFVRLFDVQLQSEFVHVGTPQVWSLVFRDNSTLIMGTQGGWDAWHFDRSHKVLTVIQEPRGGQGKVRGVVSAGGGELLVTGSQEDQTVAVWDARLPSVNQELPFKWPEGIMPKRRLILNADRAAKRLLVQRLGDGGQVAQVKHFDAIFPVASPTEDRLAVAETATEIRIWNTTTWQPVLLVKSPSNRRVYEIHFSADGQWLAAGCGEGVGGAWNLQSGEWRQILHADSDQSCIMRCSPARNVLACAVYHDNVVELWDLDQARRLDRLVLDSNAHTFCFSPDGRLLAVGETGMTISLWDTDTGVKIDTLTGHAGAVVRLAFSPDGRTLVSGSHDETARLWNMATRRELFILYHASQFNWFNFVDGSLLMAHGPDNSLSIFPGPSALPAPH